MVSDRNMFLCYWRVRLLTTITVYEETRHGQPLYRDRLCTCKYLMISNRNMFLCYWWVSLPTSKTVYEETRHSQPSYRDPVCHVNIWWPQKGTCPYRYEMQPRELQWNLHGMAHKHLNVTIGALCRQNQVSQAGVSNYITSHSKLWDVITYLYLRYMLRLSVSAGDKRTYA